MLHYVVRERHRYTIDKFLHALRGRPDAPKVVRVATYETLFALKRAPIGNYIFTDIDRLTPFEIDAAGEIVKGLRKADPAVRIINEPNRVLGRYALLRRLHEAGLNSFNVWRLDEERLPTAYPVFIRREQDALGAESPLLHNEREYRAAIARLHEAGKGTAGRIAVQFRDSGDAQGIYRKYGAFCFAGMVVPQHLVVADQWMVKRGMAELTTDLIAEEERYVFDNPHAEHLHKVFAMAEIDFGRADYCVADGRVEVFEINTNPGFPSARNPDDGRMVRRNHVIGGVLAGFASLDGGTECSGLAKFHFPKPKLHRLRDRPLWRRISDRATGLGWRLRAFSGRL
ncbi:MAG TPA: hypothetical protein VFZ03_08575 [Dongiaceae bacterium]